MLWMFVGVLLGSIVTSSHETREACEGRATLLREKGVSGKCVDMSFTTLRSGDISVTPLTLGTPGVWKMQQ